MQLWNQIRTFSDLFEVDVKEKRAHLQTTQASFQSTSIWTPPHRVRTQNLTLDQISPHGLQAATESEKRILDVDPQARRCVYSPQREAGHPPPSPSRRHIERPIALLVIRVGRRSGLNPQSHSHHADLASTIRIRRETSP